jgi:HK97 gp10 family phage protein
MPDFVHILGAKELEAALKQLPEEIAKKVATSAVMAGAKVVLEEARHTAPVGQESKGRVRVRTTKKGNVVISNYGKLKLSLRAIKVRNSTHSVTVAVTVGKAFWGMFQEFGTSKMRARPWFRPAFDASWPKALDVMGKSLGEGIERAAKRLAGPFRKSGLR